jgi:zinc transporter 1/2/3
MRISVRQFQYINAASIFVTTVVGATGPVFITAPRWTARLESLAGGVFLGAGFGHLLAEANEKLTANDVHVMGYPLAPAIAAIVFAIFTAVELFSYSEHDAAIFADDDHNCHHHSCVDDDRGRSGLVQSLVPGDPQSGRHSAASTLEGADPESPPATADGRRVKTIRFGESCAQMDTATVSLYVIMGIHSSIEGLALGVMATWESAIALLCAIVAHKPVEAFALSLIIAKRSPPRWGFMVMIALYSLLSPIGVLVGVAVSDTGSDLATGIIEAFSSGVFIFVGCHEWAEMFEHKREWRVREKLWHYGLFAMGIIWMLAIKVIECFAEED